MLCRFIQFNSIDLFRYKINEIIYRHIIIIRFVAVLIISIIIQFGYLF